MAPALRACVWGSLRPALVQPAAEALASALLQQVRRRHVLVVFNAAIGLHTAVAWMVEEHLAFTPALRVR